MDVNHRGRNPEERLRGFTSGNPRIVPGESARGHSPSRATRRQPLQRRLTGGRGMAGCPSPPAPRCFELPDLRPASRIVADATPALCLTQYPATMSSGLWPWRRRIRQLTARTAPVRAGLRPPMVSWPPRGGHVLQDAPELPGRRSRSVRRSGARGPGAGAGGVRAIPQRNRAVSDRVPHESSGRPASLGFGVGGSDL